MSLVYLIHPDGKESLPGEIQDAGHSLLRIMQRKVTSCFLFSSCCSDCLSMASVFAGYYKTQISVAPNLDGGPSVFQQAATRFPTLQLLPVDHILSFNTLLDNLHASQYPCICFISERIKATADLKQFKFIRRIKGTAVVLQLITRPPLKKTVELPPKTEYRPSGDSLRNSLAELLSFPHYREQTVLAKTLKQKAGELSIQLSKLAERIQAEKESSDTIRATIQTAQNVQIAFHSRLEDVSNQLACFCSGNWTGDGLLEILQFVDTCEDNVWTLRIRNNTDYTFESVHIFHVESQQRLYFFDIVEPKTTVRADVSLASSSEIYSTRIIAQSQGIAASRMFAVHPLKIKSIHSVDECFLQVGFINDSGKKFSGLSLASSEFFKAFPITEDVQPGQECQQVVRLPAPIADNTTTEFVVLHGTAIVSNPFVWSATRHRNLNQSQEVVSLTLEKPQLLVGPSSRPAELPGRLSLPVSEVSSYDQSQGIETQDKPQVLPPTQKDTENRTICPEMISFSRLMQAPPPILFEGSLSGRIAVGGRATNWTDSIQSSAVESLDEDPRRTRLHKTVRMDPEAG